MIWLLKDNRLNIEVKSIEEKFRFGEREIYVCKNLNHMLLNRFAFAVVIKILAKLYLIDWI